MDFNELYRNVTIHCPSFSLVRLDKTNLNAQFLVSFQLRSVDVNILYKAFEDIGFKHYIPTTCDCSDIESDDEILCFEDVYGERHDEMTMLTDKFVIAFVRKQEE